jgi:hypothetical protein
MARKPPSIRAKNRERKSQVLTPAYLGMVEIPELGDAGVRAAIIGVLGKEALIGRNLARRFRITLDHGRQVIVEP